MDYAFSLSGNSTARVEKYAVGATTLAGVPLTAPTNGETGLAQPTTTTAAGVVGVSVDAATYSTTQSSDGSDIEAEVAVVVSPDAVFKVKMSGGSTEDTALALQEVTVASATGLVITTGAEWSSPTYDQGHVWGYDGANVGMKRMITTVDSTTGNVLVPFHDTAVGDNFLRCPYAPGATVAMQLTALFTQANAIIAVGTGAPFTCVKLSLQDSSDEGRTNSYVYVVAGDHLYNLPT